MLHQLLPLATFGHQALTSKTPVNTIHSLLRLEFCISADNGLVLLPLLLILPLAPAIVVERLKNVQSLWLCVLHVCCGRVL